MNAAVHIDRLHTALCQRLSLAVGLLASAACVIGGIAWPASFFSAYLASYLFYLGIPLGSMVLLIVYHLTGGSWGYMLRRILEASLRTMPLLAALFLPIAFGLNHVYLWAACEPEHWGFEVRNQSLYLQPTYFLLRAGIFFLCWLILSGLYVYWSRREDETGEPKYAYYALQLSGPAAVVYGVTIHFAAIDWSMSLEPRFHSTIWGPLFAGGQLLSAMAFALIILARRVDRLPLAEVSSAKVQGDLSSLLLTLLVLWAYLAWCQFMLVWIGNLPIDTVWYLARATPSAKTVVGLLAICQLAVPFMLLLIRPIKQNSQAVGWIAGLILVMQLVYSYYQVAPVAFEGTIGKQWLAVVMPLALGGLWLSHFLSHLQRTTLVAPYDQNREAARHLRRLEQEEIARWREDEHA